MPASTGEITELPFKSRINFPTTTNDLIKLFTGFDDIPSRKSTNLASILDHIRQETDFRENSSLMQEAMNENENIENTDDEEHKDYVPSELLITLKSLHQSLIHFRFQFISVSVRILWWNLFRDRREKN